MHRFFIKTPGWVQRIFSSYVWRIPTPQKIIYLTFDDGPHPVITPWVLERLKEYNAEATFFCIGNNVHQHPAVYQQIIRDGHAVGNHTYQHLNGWKTSIEEYLNDIKKTAPFVVTNLFRPPYGRIKRVQAKNVSVSMGKKASIIMWDVLSADFDKRFSPEQCAQNVLRNISPGSIVVFHDSEKAFDNLNIALPAVLKALKQEGYECRKIVIDEA